MLKLIDVQFVLNSSGNCWQVSGKIEAIQAVPYLPHTSYGIPYIVRKPYYINGLFDEYI